MELQFIGRNIEITPALKEFTTEKFEKIKHRDSHISHVEVTFQVENVTHIAEANLHLYGSHIHATAEAKDMYSAIDALIDKLLGQITKYKEKHGHR